MIELRSNFLNMFMLGILIVQVINVNEIDLTSETWHNNLRLII